MKAIELVAEQLYDGSADVEMNEPLSEGNGQEDISSSISNKSTGSSLDAQNEELQMKFLVTGTSSRQHHSGRKKVVCIHIFEKTDHKKKIRKWNLTEIDFLLDPGKF